MDFIIGGLAGAGATIFSNPMDVVKIRLQMQGELGARETTKKQYKGVFHAMYVIAKKDGLLALQKGLSPAMVLGFTMNSVRPATVLTKERIPMVQLIGLTLPKTKAPRAKRAKHQKAWVVGSAGSYATPHRWLRLGCRQQTAAHPSIAVGRQHSYNGMIDGVHQIYKTEGIREFFAGAGATCVRLAIGSAAQLTTFSIAKEALVSHGICKTSPFGLAFNASAVSGVVVCVIVCPFDVTTVRLYNQGAPQKGKPKLYTGFLDCLTKIYKIEGLHGLYKGIGPLYLRMAPHTTVSLVIWDMLNNLLKMNKKS